MVNQYIKQTAGRKQTTEREFTAKDFSTWSGSLNILYAFKSIAGSISDSVPKRKLRRHWMRVVKNL